MLLIMGMLAGPGGSVWEGFSEWDERRLMRALKRREMEMVTRMMNQVSMLLWVERELCGG